MRQWFVQQRLALLAGVGLTLATAMMHGLGWTQRAELQFYDAMVRHFSTVPASDRIVHIDIDDDALARYASWPWPRDVQGELVRILHELGAKQIVVDLVWSERKGQEIRTPDLDPYADLEGKIEQIGEISAANLVSPDDELGDAIRHAEPVYLSYYHSQEEDASVSALGEGMTRLLREEFGLNAEELASRLGSSRQDVERLLASVKRRVARQRVSELVRGEPELSARQVHERLLRTPFERLTADRADVLAAYDRELSLRSFRRLCPAVPEGLRGKLPRVSDVTPPIYKVTRGKPRLGFVNFDAQADADGTLRWMPLMIDWDGVLLEQLAFAAGRDALGIGLEDLSIDAGELRIKGTADRPPMRVQLDERGRTLVNWHAGEDHWSKCFRHVPVARLLQIHDIRKSVRQNEVLQKTLLGEVMRLVKDEASFAEYSKRVRQSLDHQRVVRQAEMQDRGEQPEVQRARAEIETLKNALDQDQEMVVRLVRDTWAELKNEPNPADPAIAGEYQRFQRAQQVLTEEIPQIESVNARLRGQEVELLSQLRLAIAGKTCFLGYTATALADMVSAPPYDRMPGVMIHSGLYNSLLQGRFRTWAGDLTRFSVIVCMGLAITMVTTLRGPRTSLLFVVFVILASLLLNAIGLFGGWDYWLQLLSALVLVFVAWAIIVMIRYLVTDRQRRRFGKAVAQYVSPAVARQIADSARNLNFEPVDAVVTCLFSDLAGFTTISERLGPAGTRAVLNPYLESMSAVLHRRQALINKFMGDGIFAFFNPPILPCPGHEIAACEAAIDSQAALAELVARHAQSPFAEYFRQLSVRIGIASGSVFVGDYGSAEKLDYTCVGDVVNLAARLESANKQFGTTMIVSGATREAAGDRFAYRHIGVVQVKGQTRGVPVYELLGRSEEVPADIIGYAELFDRSVLAFARRDWPAALEGFDECLKRRPGDTAARRYLPAIRHYRVNAPPSDWAGTIELTEK